MTKPAPDHDAQLPREAVPVTVTAANSPTDGPGSIQNPPRPSDGRTGPQTEDRSHTLYFDHLDGDTNIGPRTVSGTTPAELAQAVHRHARGYLGGRRVDVHLDEDTLTGTIVSHGQTVGEFALTATPPAAPPVEVSSDEVGHLRHGWTVDAIDGLAWGVATSDRWHRATPLDERHDHARYGILTHLLAAEEPPAEYDLYRAGVAEIDRAVTAERQFFGRRHRPDENGEFGYIPQAARYWAHTPQSLEDRVIERLALGQVWPQADRPQQQALAALAACGDYEQAADALGLSRSALTVRLRRGRAAITAAWFEHETPPRRRSNDRRVSSRSGRDRKGRPRITASQLDEARARHEAGETLREIAPDYGLARPSLGALLRGDRKPAPDPVEAAA